MEHNEDFIIHLRIITSELIGYALVGSLLEPALTALEEINPRLALPLRYLLDEVLDHFHAAETQLFQIEELK